MTPGDFVKFTDNDKYSVSGLFLGIFDHSPEGHELMSLLVEPDDMRKGLGPGGWTNSTPSYIRSFYLDYDDNNRKWEVMI